MGMFQPHNYGTDFLQGLTAVNGMFNDERRLKLEEQRQAEDAKTRSLQQEGLVLDNKKKSAEVERERKLGEFFDFTNRLQSGQLQDQDKARLAGVTEDLIKDTPYITEDILQNPGGYRQKVKDLAEGVASIRTLPVGNYKYSRDDNVPEVNNMLDSYGSLLSKDRLGKTFTDSDGSVTGKAGAKYKTLAADGFMMASGEGNKAGFVPLFSVADESGNPIIGADGRRVLVPATMGTTNGADDKLRVISPEELLTKAGYAAKVANVVETLGLNDPVKRQQYAADGMKQYLSPDEQAKLVIAEGKADKTVTQTDPYKDTYVGGKLVTPALTKKEKVEAPKVQPVATGKRDKYNNQLFQDNMFNAETGKYDIPVGVPYSKHDPKPIVVNAGGKGEREGKKEKGLPVGTVNAINGEIVTRFIPVAEATLKRQGKNSDLDAATDADKEMGLHVSASGVYKSLSLTGQQVFNRTKVLAQKYTSEGQNPSEAVERALEVARKEYGLDNSGMVRSTPKQTATPPKQAPRQQAKKQSGNLSAAAKRIAEKY